MTGLGISDWNQVLETETYISAISMMILYRRKQEVLSLQ